MLFVNIQALQFGLTYGNMLFERVLPSENPQSAFVRTGCCSVFSEEKPAFRVGLWTFFLKVIPHF